MKAIIVDDENYTLLELKDMVSAVHFISEVRVYDNPLNALKEAAEYKPDIAFVDIEMPEMDGLVLAEQLLSLNQEIKVVFVTAYNQYAVHAFELNALDYILKPVNPDRFQKTIAKFQKNVEIMKETAKVKITCFDQLEVQIDGHPVKWERSKAVELFAYLLMNAGKLVNKESIIENLWSDYDMRKTTAILQTSVWNIRSIFQNIKEVKIEYLNGGYILQIGNSECDYVQLMHALDTFDKNDQTTFQSVIEKSRYYKGFLVQNGYLWSIEKDEKIKNELALALKNIGSYYYSSQDYEKAIPILKELIRIAPYEESGNNMLMNAYAKIHDGASIIRHYEQLKSILSQDYDMLPAVSTRNLYKKFIETYN